MTDDIVKRLRERSLWETDVEPAMLLEEAADEIEKLRARLEKAQSFISRADWMQFFEEERESDRD